MAQALSAETAPRYRPRRLGHINLFVSNAERSMSFYKEVCGFEETARQSAYQSGFLSNGNTHHDIGLVALAGYADLRKSKPAEEPPERGMNVGLNHFGWELENEAELVEAYCRSVGAGLSPRVSDAGTSRSNYLFDPDGVQHQFYADMRKDWRAVYLGGECDLHSNPEWRPGEAPASTEANYWADPEIRRVEAAPVHPLRVAHAVLVVKDLERSLSFYRGIGGFDWTPLVGSLRPGAYVKGTASVFDVVLLQDIGVERLGMHHAAFELDPTDDFSPARQGLSAAGVTVVETVENETKSSLFFTDPDGILLEFFVRRKGKPADLSGCLPASVPFYV